MKIGRLLGLPPKTSNAFYFRILDNEGRQIVHGRYNNLARTGIKCVFFGQKPLESDISLNGDKTLTFAIKTKEDSEIVLKGPSTEPLGYKFNFRFRGFLGGSMCSFICSVLASFALPLNVSPDGSSVLSYMVSMGYSNARSKQLFPALAKHLCAIGLAHIISGFFNFSNEIKNIFVVLSTVVVNEINALYSWYARREVNRGVRHLKESEAEFAEVDLRRYNEFGL